MDNTGKIRRGGSMKTASKILLAWLAFALVSMVINLFRFWKHETSDPQQTSNSSQVSPVDRENNFRIKAPVPSADVKAYQVCFGVSRNFLGFPKQESLFLDLDVRPTYVMRRNQVHAGHPIEYKYGFALDSTDSDTYGHLDFWINLTKYSSHDQAVARLNQREAYYKRFRKTPENFPFFYEEDRIFQRNQKGEAFGYAISGWVGGLWSTEIQVPFSLFERDSVKVRAFRDQIRTRIFEYYESFQSEEPNSEG